MRPPRIEIIHHQLHHEVPGPILLIMPLENECAQPNAEDGDVSVEKFRKAERLVECAAGLEVFCGKEWTRCRGAAWNCHCAAASKIVGRECLSTILVGCVP